MANRARRRPLIPLVLGVAMLAVVVAAGLAPNTGLVQAQTNSPYSQPASSGVSPYLYLGAALIAIAAIILALLLLTRRRRPPPSTAPPVQAWQEGPAGPSAPAPPPPGAAPAYLETPEDVGHAPPIVPAAVGGAGVAGGAAAGAAAGGAEPDIDSLMAELDKISGEILKRQPKKGDPTSSESTEEGTNS